MHEAKKGIWGQRNNLPRFMTHRKMTSIGAEMATDKATSNRGRGRGGGPGHPTQEGWVGQV